MRGPDATPAVGRGLRRRRLPPAALLVALAALGCASAPVGQAGGAPRVLIATPFDGVPIRSRDALPPAPPAAGLEGARQSALVALRGDLAEQLQDRGVAVVQEDLPELTGKRPSLARIAALGRARDADVVVFSELIAYGNIRRSWLWVLAAQGLAAGIGHGVVVAKATGNSTYGWWAGVGEFGLETATWVGGAVLGSRGIDPVLLRVWLVRTRDGAIVGHWTREGMRPMRRWFRHKGEPPRDQRLRAVADRVLSKLAPRIARRLGITPVPHS
ncbi:MAG: hypothetical protein ACM3OB_11240 [Acidobacteriota bacterium]